YRVPRYAIHGGSEVWVAAETGETKVETGETKELTIQPVDIVRMDRDFAYVAAGLNEGDFVVISALGTVTDGMAIRILVDDKAENQ
ncbi:MAG: hypothetical protein ACYSOV_06505, partial [Planctomycetota bacterium]